MLAATDTTNTGGCAATDVLNAARTIIPALQLCIRFVTRALAANRIRFLE
jgi:hypothetical protein